MDTAKIILSNTYEAYAAFLNRGEISTRKQVQQSLATASERVLLWGGPKKFAITRGPVPHSDSLVALGYGNTEFGYPQQQSSSLCRDLLRDSLLLQRVLEFAAPSQQVELIPYATTAEVYELAGVLEKEFSLQVLLPESPPVNSLWLRNYVESKVGFRATVPQWLKGDHVRVAEGFHCADVSEALVIVRWFQQQGRRCLLKPSSGFLGMGHCRVGVETPIAVVEMQLRTNQYLQTGDIVIEEFVESPQQVYPSVEVILTAGAEPIISQVCLQLVPGGNYVGEVVSGELQQESWYRPLVWAAEAIAAQLQRLGYIGHFDLDAIVAVDGEVVLTELNARRTGGSHIHDLATVLWGTEYLQQVSLISYAAQESGECRDWDTVRSRLESLMGPVAERLSGVIVTNSSSLVIGKLGFIAWGKTLALAKETAQRVDSFLSDRS